MVVPVGLSLGRGEGLLLLRREDDGGLLKLPGDDPFGAMFSSGRIHTCLHFATLTLHLPEFMKCSEFKIMHVEPDVFRM